MVNITISKIYGGFLRQVARRRELAKEITLEGMFEGDYQTREGDMTEGYTYAGKKIRGGIGTIFYRGQTEGQHYFYFVPTPKLERTRNRKLLDLAGNLWNRNIIKNLDIFPNRVTVINDLSEEEKAKIEKRKRGYKESGKRWNKGWGRKKVKKAKSVG